MYLQLAFFPSGVFQRLVADLMSTFPDVIIEVLDTFADVLRINLGMAIVLMWVDDEAQRIVIQFLPGQSGIADRVHLLRQLLEDVDDEFMKSRLSPELVLSCDDTQQPSSCATMPSLLEPQLGSVVTLSREPRARSDFDALLPTVQTVELLSAPPSRHDKAFDVFLSHAWSDGIHERVVAIAEALERDHGLRCWLDQNEVRGDVSAAMANGIDQSEASVVFVSRAYMDKVNKPDTEKDNCRAEFQYINKRKGLPRMIPCVLEPELCSTASWEGNFGFLFEGDRLFTPVLSDTPKEIAALAAAIRACIAAGA